MNTSTDLAKAAACCAVIGLLSWLSAASGAALITSWASSIALILGFPDSEAARWWRIGPAHVLAFLVGAAWANVGNSPLVMGLAVASALWASLRLNILHPPAVANAAIAFLLPGAFFTKLSLVLAGGLVLGFVALIWARAAAQPSPEPGEL